MVHPCEFDYSPLQNVLSLPFQMLYSVFLTKETVQSCRSGLQDNVFSQFSDAKLYLEIGTVKERLWRHSKMTGVIFVFVCHWNIIFSACRPNSSFSFLLYCQPLIKRAGEKVCYWRCIDFKQKLPGRVFCLGQVPSFLIINNNNDNDRDK